VKPQGEERVAGGDATRKRKRMTSGCERFLTAEKSKKRIAPFWTGGGAELTKKFKGEKWGGKTG